MRSCCGEKGNFDVNPARAFKVYFDEVRSAGGECPKDFSAIARIAHLFRHHAVDAAIDTRVSAIRIATPECLVGFIDKDNATAEGFEQAEDFFKVGFGRSYPFVAKIFHLHHRYTCFACEALDQEGLASSHGTAEEVAHGQCGEVALFP